ncbi:N-acetylmuramoyl-L-alanine amidase [Fulvivirga imtechensis]|nr:N-acetylmuramoyl-L-alanine amidase [Fulvivirga imtechensis]
MKNPLYSALFLGLIFFVCSDKLVAQKIEPIPVKQFYKDRVTRNLQFLCKEAECLDNVIVNDKGLYIYPTSQKVNKPEFILYWREMPHFVEMLDKKKTEEIIDILSRKGSHYFYGINNTHVNPAKYPVTEYKGLKVALDPGHIASNFEEARLEQRYVRAEGKHFNQKQHIEFFESNLAYTTCLVLKEMLEKKGAHVMLTHEYGKSAMGINYNEWLQTDYKKDIIHGYKEDWYNREKFEYLMSGQAPDFMLFHDVFRNMDFVARAKKINEYKPNITLVVHYNASEGGKRYGDLYLPPVTENYSMVFIPGSFLGIEIDGQDGLDQRFEMLRLLVTHDLEESDVFASNIIKALNDELKVDALPKENNFDFATRFSILSDKSEGVYHRNLYLTRVVRGPIAYSEALYQDNIEEMAKLGKKDFTIGGIKTSSRVKDVAHVYFSAIDQWLQYNQQFAKQLDALYEDKYGDEDAFKEEMEKQEADSGSNN